MDMSGFTGSNFITAEFLEFLGPNVRIETKIVSAGLREFAEGDKPVIFVDYQAKAVVLNPTRAKVLCSAYGLSPQTGSAGRSSSPAVKRRTAAKRLGASRSRRWAGSGSALGSAGPLPAVMTRATTMARLSLQ